MACKDYIATYGADCGLTFTDDQLDKLQRYYDMVVTTNEVMNLTAITEPKEFAIKHIIDSLSCYDKTYFPEGAHVIDVGTGGGFPGIPLAIYDTSLHITLFDSLQKRLRFLDEVIEALGLTQVRTLHGRAEDAAHDSRHREQYDVATSRAVARLPILLEWTMPYVKPGGHLVALKGSIYEEELSESKKALSILQGSVKESRSVTLPTLEDKRAVIYVEKVGTTPKRYPRKPKDIKAKPL